jgi:hypothetical protein
VIAFPKDVSIAQQGDERRVFDLCAIGHAENGWGTIDADVVQATILQATTRKAGIFAIINGPERIEAVLGMHCVKPWYCAADKAENWYWTELIYFVHPLHRRSRHASRLLQFAKWWEQEIKQPVVLTLLPRDDLEEKDKLFSRHGQRVGSVYLFGDAPAFHVSKGVGQNFGVVSKPAESIVAVSAQETTH